MGNSKGVHAFNTLYNKTWHFFEKPAKLISHYVIVPYFAGAFVLSMAIQATPNLASQVAGDYLDKKNYHIITALANRHFHQNFKTAQSYNHAYLDAYQTRNEAAHGELIQNPGYHEKIDLSYLKRSRPQAQPIL